MKRKCVFVIAVMFSLFTQKSFSQSSKFSFIPSAHLTVTYNKTTNLIFPFTVQSIDRGSKDILVQQPKGTENIVQVKADKPNFPQTNLSVITIDGKLYSFTVDYANQPNELNIVVGKDDSSFNALNAPVTLATGYNEALIKSVCERILETKPKHIETNRDYQMKLQLNGIYINENVIYFRLRLQNNSNVGYDVDNISFTIKDRQKSKRTAAQEISLTPVFAFHSFTSIEADSSATCIIAVPKFTLPDSKYLFIQVPEKNGGRNLFLVVRNSKIMKAKLLPGIQ
jgi:conjugative transposon TraN protein